MGFMGKMIILFLIANGGLSAPVPRAQPDILNQVFRTVGEVGKGIKESANPGEFAEHIKNKFGSNDDESLMDQIKSGIEKGKDFGQRTIDVTNGKREFDPDSPFSDSEGFTYTATELIYGSLGFLLIFVIFVCIIKCICTKRR